MIVDKSYKMRNLPCRDKSGFEMPWAVCGNIREQFADGTIVTGGGVLEWCWDKADAEDVLSRMKSDPRFSNLSTQPS